MSQIYSTAAEFEVLFSEMFDRIRADDPDGLSELVDQAMVIRFRIKQPQVDLWIDGRSTPVQTSFGQQGLDATFTAELSANSLHELLLGTLSLASALLFRKVKVQGSKSKAMKLEGLLHTMQAVYPDLVAKR